MSRFSFDKEIKLWGVKLIVKESFFTQECGKEFNIHGNILYYWIQRYVRYRGRAFPFKGSAFFMLNI